MLSIEEINSYIIPVVEKYPVERVILFGSYARGKLLTQVMLIWSLKAAAR